MSNIITPSPAQRFEPVKDKADKRAEEKKEKAAVTVAEEQAATARDAAAARRLSYLGRRQGAESQAKAAADPLHQPSEAKQPESPSQPLADQNKSNFKSAAKQPVDPKQEAQASAREPNSTAAAAEKRPTGPQKDDGSKQASAGNQNKAQAGKEADKKSARADQPAEQNPKSPTAQLKAPPTPARVPPPQQTPMPQAKMQARAEPKQALSESLQSETTGASPEEVAQLEAPEQPHGPNAPTRRLPPGNAKEPQAGTPSGRTSGTPTGKAAPEVRQFAVAEGRYYQGTVKPGDEAHNLTQAAQYGMLLGGGLVPQHTPAPTLAQLQAANGMTLAARTSNPGAKSSNAERAGEGSAETREGGGKSANMNGKLAQGMRRQMNFSRV